MTARKRSPAPTPAARVVLHKRNYVAEMRALVDQMTPETGYIRADVAGAIVARLRAEDPELLQGFLLEHAVQVITNMIHRRDASIRAAAAVRRPVSVFAAAAARHAAGDSSALADWLDASFTVNNARTVKRLADMTPEEVAFAAKDYRTRADSNARMAKFLEFIATEVRFGRVADYFDNLKLNHIWVGIP